MKSHIAILMNRDGTRMQQHTPHSQGLLVSAEESSAISPVISIERGPAFLRVSGTGDAPAPALFAVLCDPRRHVEIDGSGMLQADVDAHPVSRVGEVFTMEMHYPSLGDYRTENHIVEFEPNRAIAWTTARAGAKPAGVVWRWQLTPAGERRADVVHTYDWSAVTDPGVLARVTFPRVSGEELRQSVHRLIAAAD